MLETIASSLEARVDELAATADRETHLGVERLRGEVGRSAAQARLFAAVLREGSYADARIDHAKPDATPPRPDLRRYRTSIGPVAVFAACNFPFAFSVCGGDTVSALAAGSAVVVKAHSGHPKTSDLTFQVIRQALVADDLDPDVVQVVHGREEGLQLVRHPAIEAAAFTGSLAGGRALFDVAMARPTPIPFYGELGSLNPFVVTHQAADERGSSIADGLVQSFTMGNGQFCTKPGLILVPETAAGLEIVARMVEAARLIEGRLLLTNRMLTSYRGSVETLSTAGSAVALLDGCGASPTTVGPTIFSIPGSDLLALGPGTPLLEECFGPTTVVVTYDSLVELGELITSLPQSLTGTLHAGADELGPDSSIDGILALLQERAGRIVWNGYPTGVPVAWATQHGGTYPASTASWATSVGAAAIERFLRSVAYQDVPDSFLPPELQEGNPLDIVRRVDARLVIPDSPGEPA